MQKTITFLSLFLFSIYSTTLSAQQSTKESPRKNSVYFEGAYLYHRGKGKIAIGPFGDSGEDIPFAGYGFASLNYERQLWINKKQTFRAGLAAGLTPPLNARVHVALNIGPKLYWGKNQNWFSMDLRYCGIYGVQSDYTAPRPREVNYWSRGIYAGLGYCYTGKKGFYFNPQMILCGDNYDHNKPGRLYMGTTMSLGYSF